MEYIKVKQTKHTKRGAKKSTHLNKIIPTGTYGSFNVSSFYGEKYFITTIDDILRYGYIYLLKEKSQMMDTLKVYINEIERELERISLYRGGKYYEK